MWFTGSLGHVVKVELLSPNDGGECLVIVLYNRPRMTFYHMNTLMFRFSCLRCSQVSLLWSPFQFFNRKMQQFESNNRKKDINVTG